MKKEYSWTMEQVEPGDSYLAFYVVHQYVEVYFGDELVYSLKTSPDNKIGRTTGSNWVMIPLYQEDEGKEIRVLVTPVYESFRDRSVEFLKGSRLEIYLQRLRSDSLQMLFGVAACMAGIIFCAVAVFNLVRKRHGKSLAALGCFSVMLGLWRLSDMRITPLVVETRPVLMFYLSVGMLMIGGVPLIKAVQKRFDRRSCCMFDICCLLASVVCIIQLVLQIFNVSDLRDHLYLTHSMLLVTAFAITGNVIYDRFFAKEKKRHVNKKLYFLCAVGVIADIVAFGVKGNSSGLIFTLTVFLVYIIVTGVTMLIDYVEQEKRLKKQEEELASSRIATMLSQIQPHFLFNSLATIKYLCKKDAKEAVETIDQFSDFLRGSMNALTMKECVTFENELKFVRNYLYLEQKRFGDTLQVVYDIQEKGFLIPPLTVQPIVENAVRHGIRKKLEGGCVKISTWAGERDYFVRIEDDGVGFDVERKNKDGRNHVGIANVTNRLHAMCSGEVHITSTPGKGTNVLIQIPADAHRMEEDSEPDKGWV